MNLNATVDYKNPLLTIIVDIIKDNACCSVLPKFFQYKKYNLGELANLSKQRAAADEDKAKIERAPQPASDETEDQSIKDFPAIAEEEKKNDSTEAEKMETVKDEASSEAETPSTPNSEAS